MEHKKRGWVTLQRTKPCVDHLKKHAVGRVLTNLLEKKNIFAMIFGKRAYKITMKKPDFFFVCSSRHFRHDDNIADFFTPGHATLFIPTFSFYPVSLNAVVPY